MLQSTEVRPLTRVPSVIAAVRAPERVSTPEALKPCIRTDGLTAYFGDRAAIRDISISIPQQAVTAIIGPSGCGKSTLLRCFNRMHETVPGTRVDGPAIVEERESTVVVPPGAHCVVRGDAALEVTV